MEYKLKWIPLVLMECDKGVNNSQWHFEFDLSDTPEMKEACLNQFSSPADWNAKSKRKKKKKHTLKFFDTGITCIEKRELSERCLRWDWDGWLEFHFINVQVVQNIHYGGVGVMEENMDCSSSCHVVWSKASNRCRSCPSVHSARVHVLNIHRFSIKLST